MRAVESFGSFPMDPLSFPPDRGRRAKSELLTDQNMILYSHLLSIQKITRMNCESNQTEDLVAIRVSAAI